jgi:hypothetical protein
MRCWHFIPVPTGNIDVPGFKHALQERAGTNATSGCPISYAHLADRNRSQVLRVTLL